MAAEINKEKCTGCASCVGECPVEAISMENDQAKVDAAQCTSCGACAGSCPVEAITVE